MDTFEKREEGFELAFTHDEEMRFKARTRRNRRLGEWAAAQLGLSGPAQQDFATALVDRHLQSGDDAPLIAELAAALAKVEPKISAHRIGRRLKEFEQQAAREIQAGR